MSALKVSQLTVHYDKVPVLWELDFELPEGSLVGVIGPNGAGKSTLLKTLLGSVKPICGTFSFGSKKKLAYIPQRSSVDWNFPIQVLDVVLMGTYGERGLFKWVRKEDKLEAKKALEKVGMLPFIHRQISELSGGQQQRVFLARALVQNADLYLMDEPFSGIDATTEKAVVDILRELKLKGKTLVIVHHDLTTVKSYFDWALLLNSCIIDYGPVEDVFTEENLKRTFGTNAYLITEAKKLAHAKSSGQ